jgi:hypothetical protein
MLLLVPNPPVGGFAPHLQGRADDQALRASRRAPLVFIYVAILDLSPPPPLR